ncbi:putative ribonuclease H-like domain-containing protein [Tanacetum coccineum]
MLNQLEGEQSLSVREFDNAQIEYVLGSIEKMEEDKKIGRKREENDFKRFPDKRSLDKRFGGMDTLSLVSKYLNGMEDILDDGDSMEARKLTVEKNYGKYGRKMIREVHVEIHGFMFLVDFVVIGYAKEDETSVLVGRDFLVTSKSRVDFGIGEMRINLTMLEEVKEINAMLDALVENLEEVGSSNDDLVKMGKASRNKNNKVNKLTPPLEIKIKEIPTISTTTPLSPIYHPLTQKQKEKVKEVLDCKYKELEESKPILEALENYMTYQKKLNEVLMGRARLNSDDYGDPKPYNSNLTMADNTQAKAMGEVKNVRIQIGYQAYLVDFLILDIPVDKELPLLLGHPFLRTCGAVIDMGHEEDDWFSCFEVGRDEDGNSKYGPIAPSFLDIEDDMERALAMKAYFNPFKNIIIFKKLIDFLGDGDWHVKFEVTTSSGQKFTRMFKTKKTNRKLSGKFISEDILKFDQFID